MRRGNMERKMNGSKRKIGKRRGDEKRKYRLKNEWE
jgi:hypothetical protein